MVRYKHSKTKQKIKKNKKRRKTRRYKRRQMKGGNPTQIKNIFYIWLGETTKCGLTETNLKSWREGFPEAKIMILVIKEKIPEFYAHFDFLSTYSVELLSPFDFLQPSLDNEPVQKTVALLEKFLPFLMDGEKSLFNESFAYVSGDANPDAFNSVMTNNDYFPKVHSHFTNTSVKIAARFKDLLCFIGCIYMPNTLYLDIDTTFEKFHPEKIPSSSSPKLFLPIINENSENDFYKTDLYAVLSLDRVDIDVLVVNNYVQITADYLDAVPYYYLGFTTDEDILEPKRYNIGVSYLRDQFNMTSTVLLAFAHFIFQQPTESLSISKTSEEEFSNMLMVINKNMMMFPNIQALDPRTAYLYEFTKLKTSKTRIPVRYGTIAAEYEAGCKRMIENIDAGRPIFNEIEKTHSASASYFGGSLRLDDYYQIVISIYEFRKKINNDFLKYLIENITRYEVDEVPRPLQPDSKEDLIQLKNWICQLLNKTYRNGFINLWNLPKLYTFDIDDEDRKIPYLGKCQVVSRGNVLCDDGIIDFYKKFNKSYFA